MKYRFVIIALAFLMAMQGTVAFSEMTVTTKDGRSYTVPVNSGDVQKIEYSEGGGMPGGGPSPSVLRVITIKWPNSPTNYAKGDKDLVFEVGMGAHPQWGYGFAGIELANANAIGVEMISVPAQYKHYDANSFAGFTLDYGTAGGYEKRVMLSIGMMDRARGFHGFLEEVGVKAPKSVEYVDMGKTGNYRLDLKRWAPAGWNGKVLFALGIQNAGENNTLKVRVEPR